MIKLLLFLVNPPYETSQRIIFWSLNTLFSLCSGDVYIFNQSDMNKKNFCL